MLSAYDIDYEKLFALGYRGVIYDVDNTLVPHGAPADDRAREHFRRMKEIGFRCCFLSNNGEERVKSFNDEVDECYIFRAGKPDPEGYRAAMKKLGTTTRNTIFVGDQIFTDILGANRAGIRNYMVKYIDPYEEIQIIVKRQLEKVVLFFYFLKHPKMKKAAKRPKGEKIRIYPRNW